MKTIYIVKYCGQESDCSFDFGYHSCAYSKLEDAKRAVIQDVYDTFEDVFNLDCDDGVFDDDAELIDSIGTLSDDGMSWHLNGEYDNYYSYSVEIYMLNLV